MMNALNIIRSFGFDLLISETEHTSDCYDILMVKGEWIKKYTRNLLINPDAADTGIALSELRKLKH